ncbi:MAG: membrane integrity-associated transporter subunit PqiC [Campylobacterales bacterium]|nr:membrane integrity-associated transporter subunit PqiC [Campylobacterales bacterium]
MKYILLFLAVLIMNACTVVSPHIVEYKLKAVPTDIVSLSKSCPTKSLKLAQSFSANSLMSQTMKYTQDSFSEYAFSESKWSESPNRAFTQELLTSIREAHIFESVQGFRSRSKTDYILESNIEEFMQYFSADATHSYVQIRVAFALVDTQSAKPLDTVTLSERVEVKDISAKGGVKAFNEALSKLLQKSNLWLAKACE